jgi:hypothetical protein
MALNHWNGGMEGYLKIRWPNANIRQLGATKWYSATQEVLVECLWKVKLSFVGAFVHFSNVQV